jgi:hypothetical protein
MERPMNKLIEFTVPGGVVVVESSEAAAAGAVRGGGVSQRVEKAGKSLEESMGIIRPVADAVLAACRGLVSMTDTIEVEFGLKFSGEVDVMIAAANTDASLNLKLILKPK